MNEKISENPEFLTVKQFCEKYKWPSLGTLRFIRKQSTEEKNEFSKCFYKIGKTLLIKEKLFWAAVEETKINGT